MKNTLLIFAFIAISFSAKSADNWNGAQWIWQTADGPANSWVCYRKTIQLDNIPEVALANIAVDSKFWLWVNGQMVVFEGGVSRGPSQAGAWDRVNKITPSNSWYEEVDLKPYLKSGKNTIALLVWYWGRETNKGTHIDSKKGGLLFNCKLGNETISSDATWKMKKHPGYDENSGDNGTSVVQYKVKYDAQTDLDDWTSSAWYTAEYDDSNWSAAIEKGIASSAPWYNLEKNYVPRLINHDLQDYDNNATLKLPFVSTGSPIVCILPFNKQITPYFEIESESGKVIEVTTDNRLNKISANYTTKAGSQSFECLSWMNGQTVIYNFPAGIKVKSLKYRWMSVGEMAGSFTASDAFYERLWWMGRNTLFVCARDNFMDCPDRERALWIGDVADQVGYLFYSMDNAGRQLLKKAILTTFNFRENKVIGALGPLRVRELPVQSLQFIAQAVWPYYFNTGDTATIRAVYPQVYEYLALWKMNTNGLPIYRKWESPDNWDWTDWGVEGTIDKTPIQFALYYMALESAKKMAVALGENTQIAWYESRMNSIRSAFNATYWKSGFYSSDVVTFKDDRLNALAILSGIADSTKYAAIVTNVLVPNKFSSPHFEWMVEAAMCEAGKHAESLARMKAQYQSQVNTSGQSTLYENFPKGGSYNHAWNAPNTVLNKYIAGIEPTKVGWSEFKVCPNLVNMTAVKVTVPTVKGNIMVDIKSAATQFTLLVESPLGSEAIIGVPKNKFTVGQVKIGEQLVWDNGKFIGGVEGVSFFAEDKDFIQFKLSAGKWSLVAEESTTGTKQVTDLQMNNSNVFPNPSFNGKFYLVANYEWKVFSMEGKNTKQGKGTEIDLSDLEKSIYLLKTIDFDKILLSR